MEAELKEMREERERVARERGELSREFKRLQQSQKVKVDKGTLIEIDHEESIPTSFCDADTRKPLEKY